MTKRAESENQQERQPFGMPRALMWLVLAASWLLVTVSLATYDAGDPPGHTVAPQHEQPLNWLGWIGAAVSHEAYLMLGAGVWILVAGAAIWLVMFARRQEVEQPAIRVIGLLMLCLFASAMVSFGVATSRRSRAKKIEDASRPSTSAVQRSR